MVTDVVTNPYRGIAELLSIGFCARNTDSNPRCLIKKTSRIETFFLMQDIGGFEHRTTELVGALDVQWTSAQRGPKRSEDRIQNEKSLE